MPFATTTATKSINYTINSNQLFRVVARNKGINLTEIIRSVNPSFDFYGTPKTAYRHALDLLVKQGKIRYTLNKSGTRRDLYFLNSEYKETSKRVILQNFLEDLKAAL